MHGQQENWEAPAGNEDYEARRDPYYSSKQRKFTCAEDEIRSYYREAYLHRDQDKGPMYERTDNMKSDRYFNDQYSSPKGSYRMNYHLDRETNRYERVLPNEFDYRRPANNYPGSRRKAAYDNYSRF